MVNGAFTTIRVAAALGVAALISVTIGGAHSASQRAEAEAKAPAPKMASAVVAKPKVAPKPAPPPKPKEPESVIPLPVKDVMKSGVLIVISKSSQQMHVFKDGQLWDSSPVSTGKRGKETPNGMFPILQKRRHHRSNLYNNAPMPFMQRLTWDGIALHAGHVPGYPASHGCIRMPSGFASKLFKLTNADATTVVVTDQATGSSSSAVQLALNMPMPLPAPGAGLKQLPEPKLAIKEPELSAEDKAMLARASTGGPSIQLAAATSAAEAEAHWAKALARHPELAKYDKVIVPAIVGGKQYYRLRASGPGVKAACSSLKKNGLDCFAV